MRPFFLITALLSLAAVYGWIANIVKLFVMSWADLTGLLLVRIAGIPIPLIGAVAGWF